MTHDDQVRVAEIVDGALQQIVDEGLVGDARMFTEWFVIGSTILADGDTGTALLHPAEQRLPDALGLIATADVCVREGVRSWAEDMGY